MEHIPFPNIPDEPVRRNFEELDTHATGLASRLEVLETLVSQLAAPGIIVPFGGSTAPSGFLLCEGQSLLRADYAGLFAAIGTAFGAVDGTHFNLPDLKDRTVYGKGTKAVAATDGNAYGNRGPDHTLVTAEIPSHTHGMNMNKGLNVAGGGGGSNGYLWHDSGSVTTSPTGGGEAHNHGYLVAAWIIKT